MEVFSSSSSLSTVGVCGIIKPMEFKEFARVLLALERTDSRLAMTERLAELFQQLEMDEVIPVCYLLQGRLVPAYQSLEFQLSAKMVLRALSQLARLDGGKNNTTQTDLFGASDASDSGEQLSGEVQALFKQLGDVGLVAEKVKENVAPNLHDHDGAMQLTIISVYQQLVEIARESGEGSQQRKLDKLVSLFEALDSLGARYSARIIVGKLRLGFSTMTMLDALSWIATKDKSLSEALELAYQNKADIGLLASDFLQMIKSKVELPKIKQRLVSLPVSLGVPVVPALCQRLNTSKEIIAKLVEVIAEPKYDGLRLQIHFQKNVDNKLQIEAFSRSLENMTAMFPELQQLAEQLDCQSCILDSEAIGFDKLTNKLKVFQETITRKRKHQIDARSQSVPIKFYIFDILLFNGQSLIDKPLIERKKILAQVVSKSTVAEPTHFIQTKDPILLRQFHEQMLSQGLEGAVMKKADSQYQGGRKGWRWVKIKEIEGTQGKLADTLDLLVMGYYLGRGKRAQFGLGAILVGLLDPTTEKFLSISKIGTGISEAQLTELQKRFVSMKLSVRPSLYVDVDKSLVPDFWLEPALIVEVAADEITISSHHAAGMALRFPRLLKIREDKGIFDATLLDEVKQLKLTN